METVPLKMQRKRKFLLIAPVLVLPFVVFVLWVLGLVGPAEAQGQSETKHGLNLTLPSAIASKDSAWSKLQFYEQADRDSAKLRQQMKQDPFYNKRKTVDELLAASEAKAKYQPYPDAALDHADVEERKVNERIAAIHQELERPTPKKKAVGKRVDTRHDAAEVEDMETMMRTMQWKKSEPDPEMEQLNAMMEKIMDIQHPDRVSERIRKEAAPVKVYAVELEQKGEATGNVSTRVATNRFYSLEDASTVAEQPNTIAAVVQEDQQVQEGSIVKLRLTQTVFINGVEIPENEFVYGVARLNNNRMQVRVNGVLYAGNVMPVSLTAFADDGMEGLPVQGGALKGAGNQVIDRSLQSVGVNGLNMGIGAQVAGAAVQAGKSLLKKNNKAVKIMVAAGYPVLLKNVQ